MFNETHSTARGVMVLNLYFRVSGKIGPGPQEVGHSLLSRRVHVKVKGTLDSVEQKNYAVGEQREREKRNVGHLRGPTNCVLSRPPTLFCRR